MQATIKGKLDKCLSIFSQIEHNKKSQTLQVLKVLEKEKRPRRPAEIAGLAGLKQGNVRRIIQALLRSEKIKRHTNNRYSII